MKRSTFILILVVVATVLFIKVNDANNGKELNVYAGAGLKAPLEDIAEEFYEEYGISINYNFAGCGQHLSQMENTNECDVFIAGSSYFGDIAIEKGYIDEYEALVKHIPAIATNKDLEVESIKDLFTNQYVMAQGDEEATAIGKVAKKLFTKLDMEKVEKHLKKVIISPTANQLLVYIENGNADFAIVWEDMTINNEKFNTYTIPEEVNIIKEVPVAITTFSDRPEISKLFLEYLKSEEGYKVFEKYGFKKYQ